MTTIELTTYIKTSVEEAFDLSRNIDFHQQSASHTKETAIAGVNTGYIGHGESVTWRGKHFGLFLKHTSKIIDFERPSKFTDVMTEGHFTYFAHQHYFKNHNDGVIMSDILTYKTPYGILGKLFDKIALKSHLTTFLKRRNQALKSYLEKTESKQ